MKLIFLYLIFLIFNYSRVNAQEIRIKEKHEYYQIIKDTSSGRKKIKSTFYSDFGKPLIIILYNTRDDNCFWNKSFLDYCRKYIYSYDSSGNLMNTSFYHCENCSSRKEIYKYEFDSKNRLKKKITYEYGLETKNEKYSNGKLVSCKIGDSTLNEILTEEYKYNKRDSIIKEKETYIYFNSYRKKTSSSKVYKYDRKNNLKAIYYPFLGISLIGVKFKYDKQNRIIKSSGFIPFYYSESIFSQEVVKYFYSESSDTIGTIFKKDTSFHVEKRDNGNLTLVQDISKNSFIEYRYFYNKNNHLIREDKYLDGILSSIREFEYVYY